MVSVTLPPIVLADGGGKEAGLGLCKLSGLLEVAELVEVVAFDREARRLCRLARKKFRPFLATRVAEDPLRLKDRLDRLERAGGSGRAGAKSARLGGLGSHNRQRLALRSAAGA